ncbi:MAG: 30S ribosomal protein S12 methylthiotransferase RimO [Planctomycetes bacterium]|nr:30S ribosomal protein S12 methylthiotransferase RimO [Planctomycetota bacterium]
MGKTSSQSKSRGRAPKPRGKPSASRAKTAAVRTVSFVSLGCPKNLVDSEKMLGLLAEDGLVPVSHGEAADAVVVNTCGFLEASKDESVAEIRAAAKLKKKGQIKRLIVAGCLVQRHRAKMLDWCPDIDAMVGVFDRDRIVDAVRGSGGREQRNDLHVELPVYSSIAANATAARKDRGLTEKSVEGQGYFESDAARLRLTPRHYAYLRVSEGCNQNCAFCTIPSIRGKMRSKPVDRILGEARELIADGAVELNLIGQDTTSYGTDIGYAEGLSGMLRELDSCVRENAGTGWVRLMYAYPSCFTDGMIESIASLSTVVKYIDMPLQHINDDVLDGMRRKTSRKLIETLLAKLRKLPGMSIRTTFISGFPGETEEQHRELVRFVRDFGFDAMGVFPYSPEPGTPAGTMCDRGGAVPAEVVKRRVDELMTVQQEVAFARNRAAAERGDAVEVLIDGATRSAGKATTGVGKGGQLFAGRGPNQAPQIDGVTFVQSRQALSPGEIVRCKIVDADGYDLIAKPIEDLTSGLSLPVIR